MDERIRKISCTRKFFVCAAVLVVPAITIAGEPTGSSFLRARLVSGFGAGTDRGVTNYAATRTTRDDPPATAASQRESRELSVRVAPPNVAKSSSHSPFAIRVARQIPAESQRPFSRQVTDFAALIRKVDPQPAVNPAERSNEFDRRTPFQIRSIQVDTAPAVRRISLGNYDPNRPGGFDAQAIVHLAEPVDANSLDETKLDSAREKGTQGTFVALDDVKLHSLPETMEDRLEMIESKPIRKETPGSYSTPALMEALADPEVSGLIETLPKGEFEEEIVPADEAEKAEADDAFDEIIQWDLLLSE